jgi:hypothetical protein
MIAIHVVTREAATKPKHYFQQTRGEIVEHLSRTYVAQQSSTKFLVVIAIHLVKPKVVAKHYNLFNITASE